ncbi:MAG: M56 family metallopeptidase [Candidatus Hydrogenedentota bacterium]
MKGSVIIALVLLIQRLGRNVFPAQVRYWLWIPALLCLFVPFSFATTWSPFARLFTAVPPAPVDAAVVQSVSAEVAPASRRFTLSDVWIVGILAFSLLVLYNLIRFRRIRHNSRLADAVAQERLRQCKNELNIRRNIRLLETPKMGTPFLVGWLRPTILLPVGLTKEISRDELRFVLLHELSHVRRYDIALNWLMTTVQILHWFNPLV